MMAGSGGTFPSRPASGAGEDGAAHPQPGRLPRSRQEPFSPAGRPRPRCCPGLERLRAGARVPNPLPPTGGSGRRGGAAPTQDPQGAGLPAAPETPMRRGRAKLGCGERAHAARSPPCGPPRAPSGLAVVRPRGPRTVSSQAEGSSRQAATTDAPAEEATAAPPRKRHPRHLPRSFAGGGAARPVDGGCV